MREILRKGSSNDALTVLANKAHREGNQAEALVVAEYIVGT